jgi:glycosyltransferase involved in cell wall biosynthesis
MIKASIVIPVYNEEKAIASVLEDIKIAMSKVDYEYEIIVVDDASKDATGAIVKGISGVRYVRHKHNMGVGAARKTGVLNAKGEYIAMTDGDGTYPADKIPELFECLPEYDMAVGARNKEAGTLKFLRRPAKWVLLKLACMIADENIPDLNSGLRAFKKEYALKFFGILPNGHSWVSTITLAFFSNGYSVKYIPIDYFKRKGSSSFHPLKDTYTYFMTINRTIMYFRPLKFFVPLTIFIFLMGVMRFLYHAFVLHNVRESDVLIIISAVIIGAVGVLGDLILKLHRHNFIKIELGE